jgi:hypothetical protein
MPRLLLPIALLALLCAAASTRVGTAIGAPPAIDTTITAGPADGSTIEDRQPTFSFAATVDGVAFPAAAFHCSVDGGAVEPCASPFRLDPLDEEGLHTFSVYAEDPLTSTADPEPAARSFFLEFGEGECEEPGEELEDEEGNVEACEGDGETSALPPEECLLRTARARVFAFAALDRVRLVVRYTSFAPAEVIVGYRLSGGRGSLNLGEARDRFSKKGLFRVTAKLTEAQMAKVRAARRFTVDLNIPAAPSFCRRYETRHLTIKRTVHRQVIWFQSDSIFGTGA